MSRPFPHLAPVALSFLLSLVLAPLSGQVVINEIHYHPADKTLPEEFVEIHNAGENEADLSGWFFSGGILYTFAAETRIPPGGYLVVAEDPETLEASFGVVGVLGPYEGRISNDGEPVVLRNARGEIEDQVDFQVRFPWPLASSSRGSSMELIHPSLDNDLGGSWRASGFVSTIPEERESLIGAEDGAWKYRKGPSEPSDPPDAWLATDFVEDDTWLTGKTSIGFGDDDDNTVLDDMEGNYTTVFLRHPFTVEDPGKVQALVLGLFVDDAAIVWLNGVEVHRFRIRSDGRPSSGEARWQETFLRGAVRHLRPGRNVLAIRAQNVSLTSNDFSIDATLFIPGIGDYSEDDFQAPPTPGARNTVFAENASPQIRQVNHQPEQPPSGEPVVITAKVTDPDGVREVSVRYQIVSPGNYIPARLPLPRAFLMSRPTTEREPNPDFEDPANWSTLPMRDDGNGGDERAGDDVYTAVIPGQANRTLLRYRIVASDTPALSVTVPHKDDRSLNFACFVYDGVPPYVASRISVHPEGAGHIYSPELLTSLPVYFLITRQADLDQCIAYNSADQIPKSNEAGRDKFNWEGAFVYEGVVYDHMRYRLRQANDRYGLSGKRSMRFRFNRGHYFAARDNYGRRYPVRWRTINTGKMFDNKDVGNFGLTETLNHILWNLVGVPSPWMHTFHLRVIRGEDEVPEGALGQYLGDFFGMHLSIEDYDARFMDTHNLEDGNLYKLKDGIFDGNMLRRNQGRFAVTTDADFQNIRRNLRPERDETWLHAHVNYDRWYRYHAVVEGIRHYDFRPSDTHSKNRAWYFEPRYEGSEFGRVWTLPWDSDASWGPNWNSGIDYSKNAIFAGGGKPAFKQEYRNFIREFRDLIWTEEVLPQMIDDLAAFVIEFSRADRDRWRGAPAQAGRQDFGPIERKIEDMKRFAFVSWTGSTGPTVPAGGRARHLDNLAGAEGDRVRIPETPSVISMAPDGFPADALTFEVTPFVDPDGDETFGGIKWRLGEVSEPGAPFDPTSPRIHEWPAIWEEESIEPVFRITLPETVIQAGHRYRVRAKVRDDTNKWSHWSEAVEFVAGERLTEPPARTYLRVTEIMYHPDLDSAYEFIELQNIGTEPLDLSEVRFSDGIEFSFAGSDVTSLRGGDYVVVVRNRSVFATRYDTSFISIAGEYSGRLSNGGERIELLHGKDTSILAFEYDDAWYPSTDGSGFSLVINDPLLPPESWGKKESWRRSGRPQGSPGVVDTDGSGGLQRPGNFNQDRGVNISDAIFLLRYLFVDAGAQLPCGDGSLQHAANRTLLDVDGDRGVNIGDAVHLLLFLFSRGEPPALGTRCVPIAECPDLCIP